MGTSQTSPGKPNYNGLDLEKTSRLRSRQNFFLDIPFYRTSLTLEQGVLSAKASLKHQRGDAITLLSPLRYNPVTLRRALMSFRYLKGAAGLGFTLFSVLACAAAQQANWADPGDPTAQSLIDMERQWAEASCTHSTIVEKILADDFQGTSPDGKRYSKAEEVAEAKDSKVQARDCALLEAKVHFFGEATALVYGSETSVRKGSDGRGHTRRLVWTDTWLKRDGNWRIVAAQDTLISDNSGGAISETEQSQPSARERLLGTWRLVSDFEIHPDGSRRSEYGPNPLGYLMYDKTGHMCATLATPNTPRWTDPAKPTDQERVITHKSMEAYCGTFEVQERVGQVIHRPELAEWPHYIGSDQIRHYRFEGDRLVLSLEEIVPGGEKYAYEITWRRID
jgi:Lipocalin-like domain/Domain of unknown function (DUF4440)